MENHVSKGERHGNARLTADIVRQIRASEDSISVIARKYGLSMQWVWKIRKNLAWAHLS